MKKKALIIAVVGGFLPQFETENVRILQEYGYEVHYAADLSNPVYSLDTNSLEEEGIIVHPVSIRKSPYMLRDNISAFRQIRRIVKREGINLIHCHNPVGGVIGRLCTIGMKPRPYVIYTAHGFHFYSGGPVKNWLLYYPIERLLAHRTDVLITINREDYRRAKGFMLRRGGIPVWIRGVGVDPDRFRPHPDWRDEVRNELGLEGDRFHIVTAGEFNRNKNCRTVIEAIRLIRDEHPDEAEHMSYSIFGTGFCADEWQKIIDSNGLGTMVRIYGFRKDMERVLSSADVFCFASIREGLGIAAIEALMCGVPLICADNRGTREYAVDNENAIVVDALDIRGYADAILGLYRDRDRLYRLGSRAKRSVSDFSISETSKIMRSVYERADRSVTAGIGISDNERLQRA